MRVTLVLGLVLLAASAHARADERIASPDHLREVWTSPGCHCLLGATRPTPDGKPSSPAKLFEIRGAIGRIAFSPDGSKIAFENPRADETVHNQKGDPAMRGFSPARQYSWGFIAVYDFASGKISYVDPSFATDIDPRWTGPASIAFTRHVDGLPAARLTRPLPAEPAIPATARGSLAALMGVPFIHQPAISRDGEVIAFATREGATRAIYVIRDGQPAKRLVSYDGDDGIEIGEVELSEHGDLLAFVRGGRPNRHGEYANPLSRPAPIKRELWLADTVTGARRVIGDGNGPQFLHGDLGLVWIGDDGAMIAPQVGRDGRRDIGPASVMIPGRVANLRFSGLDRAVFTRDGSVMTYDLATDRIAVVAKPAGATDSNPIWSPDGSHIAFRRTIGEQPHPIGAGLLGYEGPFESKVPWSLMTIDAEGGELRRVWQAKPGRGSAFFPLSDDPTSGGHRGDQLFWTAGGQIAFPWEADGWNHLYAVPATGGEATLLTPGDGDVEAASMSDDRDRIIAASNIGDLGRRHLLAIDPASGRATALTSGEASEWAPTPIAGGRTVYVQAGWAETPALRLRAANGAVTTLAKPAPPAGYAAETMAKPKLVEVRATDGAMAYGQLFVPKAPRGCGVVFAHGGIQRQMLPGFHYMEAYANLYEVNQYLAAQGCAVLSIEYRSSIMRGHGFRNPPGWGTAGASEYPDILGAARYLQDHKDLKVRRVGIYGLSWGGYNTAQALARNSDVFKAGFDLAGVHETFGDRAKNLPAGLIGRWRSPVFLVQGDDDRNVEFYQGMALANLLRAANPPIETRLKVVPGETHELSLTFHNMVETYSDGTSFLLEKLRP